MSEQIVLPRSGIAAEVSAVISYPFACFVHGVGNESGQTREECIAKMDARVLALRAALLPPDAVIVTKDEAWKRIRSVMLTIASRQRAGWSEMQIAGQLAEEAVSALLDKNEVDHAE